MAFAATLPNGATNLLKKSNPAQTALSQTGASAAPNAIQPTRSTAVSTAAPAPEARTDLVDQGAIDKNYDAARQQYQTANDNATNYANWQNGVQSRNASNNAARAGLAAGGASYLASSRQAQLNSANNLNNVYATNANNMAGTYTQQAAATAQTQQYNAGREATVQDNLAAQTAEHNANQVTTSSDNFNAQLREYSIYTGLGSDGKQGGATNARARDLQTRLSQASPGTPEYQQVQTDIQKYLGALSEAKTRWQELGKGQAAYGGDFQKYLKAQEKSGYFN